MDVLPARAVINEDGTVTLKVAAGTAPGECDVVLPLGELNTASAAARTLALAGAWADWDDTEFRDFLDELAARRQGNRARHRDFDAA